MILLLHFIQLTGKYFSFLFLFCSTIKFPYFPIPFRTDKLVVILSHKTNQFISCFSNLIRKSDPQRYDIVIFYYPDDEKQKFIKRVIGLPGETVTIRDGKVYINDSTEPLRDDFCPETPVGDFGPYEVPEGCYFMLGDNRNVSKDSRYWLNPYVEKDKIIGKAFLRYWPLNKISMIE